MKTQAKVLSILCGLLCAVSVSCAPVDTDTLHITSTDYPDTTKLHPAVFNATDIHKIWNSPENLYGDFSCYVSLEDGEICIGNESGDVESHVMRGDNGYFMGLNLGEFDGWVYHYPYYSALSKNQPSLVAAENCKGFLKINNKRGFLFTDTSFVDSAIAGKMYELALDPTFNSWSWRVVATFHTEIRAFTYVEADDCVYVVTADEIMAVSKDFSTTVIVHSDILSHLDINSVILLDGRFYCGSSPGVYEYDANMDIERWYPMTYDNYLNT